MVEKQPPGKKSDFTSAGFKEIPNLIVETLDYDLGRNRHLSIQGLGTPNEMLFLSESDEKDPRIIKDIICLRNFDYDGYLNVWDVVNLITIIKGRNQ